MTWATTVTPPERQHGESWATEVAPVVRRYGPSWYARLEKVADYASNGTLSATVQTTYPYTTAAFGTAGTLTAPAAPRKTSAVPFSTSGVLSGTVGLVRNIAVSFTAGTSGLVTQLNEGLSGVVIDGSILDGLSATVTPAQQLPVSAALTGAGTLSATTVAIATGSVLAQFASTGALSATVTPKIPGPLSGAGSLSGSGFERYFISGGAAGVTVSDDFNRADTTADLGADWINRLYGPGISGNAAYTSFGGAGWASANHVTPMGSDDMEVSVVVGSIGGGDGVWVGLGYNEAGEGAFVYNDAGGGYYLYNRTVWSSWYWLDGGSGPALGPGDKITLSRVGNVYTTLRNDTPVFSWADSADVIPRDSSHRLVDMGLIGTVTYDSFNASSAGVGGQMLAGSGTLSASVTLLAPVLPVSAALSGDGALSATAIPRLATSASLVGDGSLSATTLKRAPVAAALTGGGTLSATVSRKPTPPDIVSISPGTGNFDVDIVLGGTNFVGVTSVTMDGVPVRNLSVNASTQITFNPPFMTNGTKTVTVTNADGSDTAGFVYSFSNSSATYTTTGAYTYTIPSGCRYIDVILLGAGGGGGGCNGILQGEGGGAGTWDYTTWERGVHIPDTTTQITGSVGVGGTAGTTSSGTPGGNGGASTTAAVAGGSGARSGAGGIGGKSSQGASSGVNGDSPGNVTVQGVLYTGGGTSSGNPANGNAPGGGAASRNAIAGNGGVGARGQVWFRAWA